MTKSLPEMAENEFIHYQSTIINHVDSVNFEDERECVGEVQYESNYHIEKIKTNKQEDTI